MTGTRIIYPGAVQEKTIQLLNQDDYPNLVQVWVNTGSQTVSAPEVADAPFVTNPAIFRLEPHTGQAVRLLYTGTGLPQDRESLFYLTFSQLPALNSKKVRNQNLLVLMAANRVKLLYRPSGLRDAPDGLARKLRFAWQHGTHGIKLHVDNPTPFYAMVRTASATTNGLTIPVVNEAVIAPLSSVDWDLPATATAASSAGRLNVVLVNDYGVDVSTQVDIEAGGDSSAGQRN